jgi:hypothetical protein
MRTLFGLTNGRGVSLFGVALASALIEVAGEASQGVNERVGHAKIR